jgi:two-component system, sensor histidine kinase and response regulator
MAEDPFVKSYRGSILTVDDTPDNLRLLSRVLSRQGFQVRKALDGQQAIASAHANVPDLILLDIKMPEMNGYEVCQSLKADPQTAEVPIIFISALDDVFDKVTAFSVGGADYITKPFQEAEVLARVEHQLRLRRLQQQLVEQNAELARSNRELEQFAYIVSHDLQQPLQSITGYATLLLMQQEATLDSGGQHYLNRIVEAGGRMQRLIQNLLTYAQLGTSIQTLAWVDCNDVVTQAIDNLRGAIAEKDAMLTCDRLPTLMGSEMHLIQLFQNLISNAIKFTHPNIQPHVTISATPYDEEWLFKVQDNGIGIPADQLTQIFEVFQRSPDAQNYPGQGIGLATCKKIVENHQGKIWAESQLNSGTTFCFTLRTRL